MPLIPIIAGPTASGKSAVALELARVLEQHAGGAEIVSADSMQVYRGLDIGTAKPTPEERAATPHHLIDCCEPDEPFNVDRWRRLAEEAIEGARSRGRAPVVCGGSHLHLRALLDGLFDGPRASPEIREALRATPPEALRAELERVDPEAAHRIHPNDTRRAIRALEVFRATGAPISAMQTGWDADGRRADALFVALEWPRETLSGRINDRVRDMVGRGLVEEARALWRSGALSALAGEALGYKQLVLCFEGSTSLEDAIERIKIETRRFAKNQRTWLRRILAGCNPDLAIVVDASKTPPDKVAQTVFQSMFRSR